MFMLGKQYQIRASVEVNADYWSRVDRSLELVEYQIYEEQFAEYNF